MKIRIEVRAGSGVRMAGSERWELFAADGEYVIDLDGAALYQLGRADAAPDSEKSREASPQKED